MRGKANTTGVDMNKTIKIPSIGDHLAIIEECGEKTTKNGDPMINIKLKIAGGLDKDLWLYDNIVIPKLGSPAWGIMGRTMHFLKCVGEPFEGEFDWDTDNWVNKIVTITVKHEAANDYHDFTKAIVSKYSKVENIPAPF